MPLYMDIHLAGEELDLEEVRANHQKDLAVQYKYGVQHIHYYANAKEGVGFCLMSGPDKESCIDVHREAHGNIANNVIEVEKNTYELLMGNAQGDDSDLVRSKNGALDLGYRFVLFVELIGAGVPISDLLLSTHAILLKNEGRMTHTHGDRIIAFFSECNNAVHCAGEIIRQSDEYKKTGLDLQIGLAAGEPVTETGDQLFEETIELAGRLAKTANPGQGLVSYRLKKFYKGDLNQVFPKLSLSIFSQSQEAFLGQVFKFVEEQLKSGTPSVEQLSKQMGVSRPQLYRKIKALTGESPKEFIENLRLSNATALIKSGKGNISEIAYQLGYSHPSILSRQFKKRFGISPSKVVELIP